MTAKKARRPRASVPDDRAPPDVGEIFALFFRASRRRDERIAKAHNDWRIDP